MKKNLSSAGQNLNMHIKNREKYSSQGFTQRLPIYSGFKIELNLRARA
jgi:hypothetical protein